jgi:phospholipase C
MGFYNETDLPFYYSLAETFAIDDHYHCDVVGPTVPNRFYLLAATSFGHLTTNEIVPPDMFDFVNAPLMNVNLTLLAQAPPPNLATDGNGSCATAH